ncbi:MAG: hypothetical protein FWC29_06235 [Methanomassiliicoccaceae archaeon]|nr:hypothetical protein [Methanomassiliicoccaceae archaeon]
MERIVINGRKKMAYVTIIFLAVLVIVCIIGVLLGTWGVGSLIFLPIWTMISYVSVRRLLEKEIIVIEDCGLTINGTVMLGPIPWDCVSRAELVRIALEKHLKIRLTNMSKLEEVLGKDEVQNKV